jgi:hypothetical protein
MNYKPPIIHAKYIKPNSIIAINVTNYDMEDNNDFNHVIIIPQSLVESEQPTRKKCYPCKMVLIIITTSGVIIFSLVLLIVKFF